MSFEETAASIANVISSLARQSTPPFTRSVTGDSVVNAVTPAKISLPGPDTVAKNVVEQELWSLAARIQILEARALTTYGQALPTTPNESPPPAVVSPITASGATKGELTSSITQRGCSNDTKTEWVTNLLAADELSHGERSSQTTELTHEQLGHLRDHVNKQSEEIVTQKEIIEDISNQLSEHHEALGGIQHGEAHDTATLKRELIKAQGANLAFQKALREIGNIVTAVAKGDLGKKVLLHATEMDPEIALFKRTINNMVDQLQDFATQVTQLAKEVGTEGKLGGQAKVPGVQGIWAELTNNGLSNRTIPFQKCFS